MSVSVCLSVNRITKILINFMKLYEMAGHNQGTIKLILCNLNLRSRSLEVRRSRSFANNSEQKVLKK